MNRPYAVPFLFALFALWAGLKVADILNEKPKTVAEASAKAPVVAPDFALSDLSGKTVGMSQFKGQKVVVHFFTTWCGYCKTEMPELQKFAKASPDTAFVVISVQETKAGVMEFMARLKANGVDVVTPVLLDPDGKVADTYGVTGYPETFFVDENGNITRHFEGADDWSVPEEK